jgi:hypothetical protein
METFAVQGNYELDDKSIKKKVKQLEGQARQKITEASASYQKGNEIKYGIYKTYIERFWSGHEEDESQFVNGRLIEEQSNDLYFQASTNRSEASKMPDDNDKIQKLNQANEFEKQAIDKQVTALGYYHNIPVLDTPAEVAPQTETYVEPLASPALIPVAEAVTLDTPYQQPQVQAAETTLPGQVVINAEMIAMYNRYLASQGRPEDSLSTTGFANISSFDAERILQMWYASIYGPGLESAQEQGLAAAESKTPETEEITAELSQAAQSQEDEVQLAVVENERQAAMIPADDDIIYRVQIAANKTELGQKELQSIYYGNKSVEMVEENGWYKYSVGDFTSYADASKFRKSCGVKNAFIVAYRKGKRFIPGSAEVESVSLPTAATGEKNMPAGLIFRIQVAATRAPLTKEQVVRIYPGHYSVEMVEEENWYKYQLMGVRLYSDALAILKDIPVKGAFISAYEDGVKIRLFEGVVKNRDLERTVKALGWKNLNETEYHVQIAASRYPIKKEDFSSIYTGNETVSLIIEEGWYKYRIKAGNSYELAQKIKTACGVEKAFVIPYKRARKISINEAIQHINP